MAVNKKVMAAMNRKGSSKKGTQIASLVSSGNLNVDIINLTNALRNKEYSNNAQKKAMEKELERLEIYFENLQGD